MIKRIAVSIGTAVLALLAAVSVEAQTYSNALQALNPVAYWQLQETTAPAAGVPALAVCLTLRDARTSEQILPVYYEDNYFSLLPGESRTVRIESRSDAKAVQVTADGWNVEPGDLH